MGCATYCHVFGWKQDFAWFLVAGSRSVRGAFPKGPFVNLESVNTCKQLKLSPALKRKPAPSGDTRHAGGIE